MPLAYRFHRSPWTRVEQFNLGGLSLPMFPKVPGQAGRERICRRLQDGAAVAATLFWSDGNAHAARDAGRDLPWRGGTARVNLFPSCWFYGWCAWLGTPAYSPYPLRRTCSFNRRDCVRDYPVVEAKVYDSSDVEVARFVLALRGPGVDVASFPWSILMSAKIL